MQPTRQMATMIATACLFALLTGCGKAAPAAPQAPAIDSVFTKMPTSEAKPGIAKQQQEQQEGNPDARRDTTKVGAPSDDKRG